MLFCLFAATLLCVAIFHKHNLLVAAIGFVAITSYRILHGFNHGNGSGAFFTHLGHEWVTVANIFMLIVGFEIVAQYFSASKFPVILPRYLPDNWTGGLSLLGGTAAGSFFLDNIAAGMIAGAIATAIYKGRVHVGFIVAIVMASNAGGAGSIIGDTTTTMMWISGIPAIEILPASIGSIVAFCFFAPIAALQQQRYCAILKDPPNSSIRVDTTYLKIVVFILALAAGTNMVINQHFKQIANDVPWIGLALWIGILSSNLVRRPHWSSIKEASKSAIFLSCLILSASMMPISDLPKANIWASIGLGFVSAVFDNIPLTALALKQGGYNPALLAYCVGVGGSLTWFGSSAGVAICNEFPAARSLWQWVKGGFFAVPAYLLGAGAIVLWNRFFE